MQIDHLVANPGHFVLERLLFRGKRDVALGPGKPGLCERCYLGCGLVVAAVGDLLGLPVLRREDTHGLTRVL